MKKPKIRVCVPYPNHGGISPETSASLEALRQCEDVEVNIVEIQGTNISYLRNLGVNKGASAAVWQSGFDFDYYLSVDADIAFTTDNVMQLISRDMDIVGGAYQDRGNPDKIVAGNFIGNGTVTRDGFLQKNKSGLQEVDWIGAGFTLIKREVFIKMRYPWYHEYVINYTNENRVTCAAWAGEDVGFCAGARTAGYKIYCDCDCKVEHLTNNNKQRSDTMLKEMEQDLARYDNAIAANNVLIARKTQEVNRLQAEIEQLVNSNISIDGARNQTRRVIQLLAQEGAPAPAQSEAVPEAIQNAVPEPTEVPAETVEAVPEKAATAAELDKARNYKP